MRKEVQGVCRNVQEECVRVYYNYSGYIPSERMYLWIYFNHLG